MNSENKTDKHIFLTGFRKFIFLQYFKIYIFCVYLGRLIRNEINLKQFVIFMKRALLLFDKIKINKVVKTRGVYKMHIYLPAFPTPAFFIALDKFLAQGNSIKNIYPTSVLLSMGKACNHCCPHCYQRLDNAKVMPPEMLRVIAKNIQDLRISFINIEGGEPLVEFDRLAILLNAIDPKKSEIWVNSNGSLLNEEKAQKMKDLGVFGVMISLHHWDREEYDRFAGQNGSYDAAISALRISNKVGLSTAINCTGTQDLIKENGFEKIMQIAKDNDCAYVQLIHEKPAGAWLGRKGTLDKDYVKKLCDYHLMYSIGRRFNDYPAISSQAFESQPENFGCTAGGIERFYINAAGDIQPCEFLNVSFGNVMKEPFIDIYKRMVRVFNAPRTTWLCCTESRKIEEEIQRLKIRQTPLPEDLSKRVIDSFDFGSKTALYEKMKLYGK